MTPRTLKEVAQAGLVLGFEWIARDDDGGIDLFEDQPHRDGEPYWHDGASWRSVQITDYPDLPPEKSLLKLSDIVEDKA